MPPNTDSALSGWVALADAADRGELYLNSDAAARCFDACETYIDKLRSHKASAVRLARVDGLGTLPSGIALAQRFSEKAAGGRNNMVDVLQSHIDVVMKMQVVFHKFFTDTGNTDDANASGISQQGPR